MVTLNRSLNKFWNLMYAKTSWPKAWADGDPRCSTSDSSSWRYSFILAGGIIGKARSIQTNPEFTKWQGLQTEGVSITFKYLALRPLAIIEPSKSLLRDLLPHVLKMEIHFWYKLFVHCVESDFESTSWGSILHLINSLPVQFMWKIILNQQSSEEAQYMSAPNQFTLTFTWDIWNMQPWKRCNIGSSAWFDDIAVKSIEEVPVMVEHHP